MAVAAAAAREAPPRLGGSGRTPAPRRGRWDEEEVGGCWGLQLAWCAAQTAEEPAIPARIGGRDRAAAADGWGGKCV